MAFGRWKPFVFVFLLLMLSAQLAFAQITKIKGRVTDSQTGEGIPFAGVYFKDSKVGVYTDLDGYYTLETRNLTLRTLCVSILGYESLEMDANVGNFAKLDFKLNPVISNLSAVVVKPDNSYMKSILHKIDDNKKRNDPKNLNDYSCDVYTKMELDITNPREQITNKKIVQNFGFIFDYIDTSVVSGQPYLPVLISESAGKKYHSLDPEMDKEVLEASRVSGFEDNSSMLPFTGSMYLKVNFYDNYINAFNLDVPSPLCAHGMMYYNYFLIDSINVDGRKTYVIRFHPGKNISSVAFDGEMQIDAKDFAMRKMHAKLKKYANVNWVRDFVMDVEHRRLNDSTWFYSKEKMYADFSVTMNDSSKMLSLLGNREIAFTNPVLDRSAFPDEEVTKHSGRVMMNKGGVARPEAFWDSIRPYELSQKEKDIYTMVDSVKNVPLYKNIYTAITTIVTGYYDGKYLGYGPYNKLISFNNLEGLRLQFGLRTTKTFSKKVRYTIFGAYGFKDKDFKGGGTVEYMIGTEPFRKLTLNAFHDVRQQGLSASHFSESSIFVSVLSRGGQKRSMVNEVSLDYEHEHTPGFTSIVSLAHKRIFSNRYVPMITPDGESMHSVASNNIHYAARFSFDESFVRGTYVRTYVPSRRPVITLDLIGGVKGIARNDFEFFRPELSFTVTPPIPPFGSSTIRLNAGTILGKVPYPLLKIHEGNGTYFLDQNAFSCMDFYEFASDTWVSLMYEHNFNGYFLGKIPLLKKLNWREALTVKAAYGTLRDENDGCIGQDGLLVNPNANPYLIFPEGMEELKTPYVEIGAGITNIFRLLRVDATWRLTHRHKFKDGMRTNAHNFSFTFGFEFKF